MFGVLMKKIAQVYSMSSASALGIPLMGFGGYLPFGMECAVIAAWIDKKLIRA